jgi:hypothetical protein
MKALTAPPTPDFQKLEIFIQESEATLRQQLSLNRVTSSEEVMLSNFDKTTMIDAFVSLRFDLIDAQLKGESASSKYWFLLSGAMWTYDSTEFFGFFKI